MENSLAQSYEHCRAVAKQSGSNFYYSFLLLPRAKRDALCVIYAFMRHCDDLSDEAKDAAIAKLRLADLRHCLDRALSESCSDGKPHSETSILESPLWPAFADTVCRYKIPIR